MFLPSPLEKVEIMVFVYVLTSPPEKREIMICFCFCHRQLKKEKLWYCFKFVLSHGDNYGMCCNLLLEGVEIIIRFSLGRPSLTPLCSSVGFILVSMMDPMWGAL